MLWVRCAVLLLRAAAATARAVVQSRRSATVQVVNMQRLCGHLSPRLCVAVFAL